MEIVALAFSPLPEKRSRGNGHLSFVCTHNGFESAHCLISHCLTRCRIIERSEKDFWSKPVSLPDSLVSQLTVWLIANNRCPVVVDEIGSVADHQSIISAVGESF